MVYITNSNFKTLEKSFSILRANFTGNIYKEELDIFSERERNELIYFQHLLQLSPELNKLHFKSQFRIGASYHHYKDCKMLNSDFITYKKEVNSEGRETQTKEIRKNSAINEINLDIKEIENRIENLLVELNKFTKQHAKLQKHLKDKSFIVVSAKKGEMELIENYYNNINLPIIALLKNYYVATLNPEMNFEEVTLKSFGLQVCRECYNRKLIKNFDVKDIFKI
jgi:hypothetical protein